MLVSKTLAYFIYNIVLCSTSLVFLPFFLLRMAFTGKYRSSFKQKLGFLPPLFDDKSSHDPRFWVHAVSVGEVAAVSPLVEKLRNNYPKAMISISTGTETGQKMARQILKDVDYFFYFPLDFPLIVKRVFRRIKPDLVIFAETEIWPNFLRYAERKKIKVVLVNGRFSDESFRGYQRTRFLFQHVLGNFAALSMTMPLHAERVISLGAPEDNVFVYGNMKFDRVMEQVNPALIPKIRSEMSLNDGEKVFIAGSTHRGEEEEILVAYQQLRQKYPDLVLIIAPRHPERTGEVKQILQQQGLTDYLLRTDILEGRKRKGEKIVILNTIGELFGVYSTATVVFCGASLVPKGGQNILEPAAWGKVVLYGPYMGNFPDARELLEETGAGIMVKDVAELKKRIEYLLADEMSLEKLGKSGQAALLNHGGASLRNAELICRILREDD